MASITHKDLLMMATQLAAVHIANPVNNIGMFDETSRRQVLENSIADIKYILRNEGVSIAETPFQQAVVEATNK